jgi:hypothetical protein
MTTQNRSFVGTINGSNLYPLPEFGRHGGVVAITFDNNNAYAGNGIVMKAKAKGAADTLYKAIPYTRLNVADAASDATVVSTKITNSGLIQVVLTDGLDIAIDASGAGDWTSGSMDFYASYAPVR